MVTPPTVAPEADERFGKYRILQRLAVGGMAHIFLATLDGPDGFSKACVIKRILPEYANLEPFSRMFADEAKVAALLTHPNIVQVFDFGKIDGQYYLAMEWIQGQSLDRIMRHAAAASMPLGLRVTVDVGLAMSDALTYAHAKTLSDGTPLKLVHRDITPGNVLVSRDGIVKLADFGIVKSSVNLERTVAGVVKGKYAYMSPEQITNRELDHRSDLYSLGIVLYEASTGRRLFKRDTMEATIVAASQGDVPPPSQVSPGFPPDLERILLRLLAKDPDARYPNARELHDDLERFRGTQHWTSGGRELATLMATLFPPDAKGRVATAVAVPGSMPGSSSQGSTRTPTGISHLADLPPQERGAPGESSARVVTGVMARGTDTGATGLVAPPEQVVGAESFPWGLAAAAGAAAVGSALFWLFVA
ncbi:serine/threonine protein kinase [Corallococcus sp. ZKHCc1 1396]|uniref:Serine/threonine protein kinase n=1 Tax=Corallococcus soli TaxID=2710757 RepID=A0ABR9PZL3_9BACT|nr:serine/threonine-protein kinase [Corallococcus soli]MBE4753351.1 serine/threonine protein kinase [Corallococcus soli]